MPQSGPVVLPTGSHEAVTGKCLHGVERRCKPVVNYQGKNREQRVAGNAYPAFEDGIKSGAGFPVASRKMVKKPLAPCGARSIF
jgi:hypothetical protein